MSNPNYIEQQWREFSAKVGYDQAPVVQQVECRRAFFAGALALMNVMFTTLEHDEPHDVTEADLEVMDHVSEEFKQYQRDLLSGKA